VNHAINISDRQQVRWWCADMVAIRNKTAQTYRPESKRIPDRYAFGAHCTQETVIHPIFLL